MILIRLVSYFRFTGTISILAWLSALLMLARNWRHPQRTRLYWTAFALSWFALATANKNFVNMASIGLDQSAELEAQEERAEAAEEADAEAASTNETQDADAVASTNDVAAAATNETEAVPLYKQQGKIEREAGKKKGDKTLEQAAEVDEVEQVVTRTLPAIDLFRANHYARMYLVLARILFWVALALCIVDYLAKFNTTFGAYAILPIACRFVDLFSRKSHSVIVRKTSRAAMLNYLKRVVRKGESFVYCGSNDPWSESETASTPKIRLGDSSFPVDKRRRPEQGLPSLPRLFIADPEPWIVDTAISGLERISVQNLDAWKQYRSTIKPGGGGEAFSIPRLSSTALNGSIHANFVLESTWFGRQCLVVEGDDAARKWLAELQKFLRTRVAVLAKVRRTVNIVWDVSVPIPDDELKELLFLCEETNYKLLLVGPQAVSAEVAGRFEETYDEMPQP